MRNVDNQLHITENKDYSAVPEAQAKKVRFNYAEFHFAITEVGDLEITLPRTAHISQLNGGLVVTIPASEDAY